MGPQRRALSGGGQGNGTGCLGQQGMPYHICSQVDDMKSILLVQPNYRHTEKTGVWMANVPLGLCYIAAVLRDNGFEVQIKDANALNLKPADIAFDARDFDVVGVTGMTPAHKFIKELQELLPKDMLKIIGGPHATGYDKELLEMGYDIVRLHECCGFNSATPFF